MSLFWQEIKKIIEQRKDVRAQIMLDDMECLILQRELLDKLASIVRLPPAIEDRRSRLHALQDAVDAERVNQEPTPFFKYPVKLPLYAHQMRGANMALLTFGWVPVKGA